MLEVIKLSKTFNGFKAIENISFSVEKGKIFGLLGPNGAGKTTTIRSILNIVSPSSGEVLFSDKFIDDEFYDLIGYLPEERGLYRKSKVADVINYFARLKNMNRNEISVKSKSLMEKLGILEFANKNIEELSKGNQQKVQFLTSIIHEPELLILDEPFAGLDPINQKIIKDIISGFINSGRLVIISTHMMEIAESLCSDIFVLNKGKEILSGPLRDIKNRFGSNTYQIKFKGNASFLKTLSEINNVMLFDDVADITLNHGVNPAEVLKLLVDKIEVQHFTHIEPTLNNIFVETVMGSERS